MYNAQGFSMHDKSKRVLIKLYDDLLEKMITLISGGDPQKAKTMYEDQHAAFLRYETVRLHGLN